jgi:phosphoribosylformylglycinamidine (FGAM) synthase-like enzyme
VPEFNSLNALHEEPSASNQAIRLEPDLADQLQRALAGDDLGGEFGEFRLVVGEELVPGGMGGRTPGADAGVVRLTPSERTIAVSLDGNGRRTWLDPRRGAAEAVCEAARNVACVGARGQATRIATATDQRSR